MENIFKLDRFQLPKIRACYRSFFPTFYYISKTL